MRGLFDSFWRAAACCIHPRVILWSLLPLLMAVGLVLGLAWLYWDMSVAAMQSLLDQWSWVMHSVEWLDSLGLAGLTAALAPLFVVLRVVPVVVVLSPWMYSLVFAFSSLWFAHFALVALQGLRSKAACIGPPSGMAQQICATTSAGPRAAVMPP